MNDGSWVSQAIIFYEWRCTDVLPDAPRNARHQAKKGRCSAPARGHAVLPRVTSVGVKNLPTFCLSKTDVVLIQRRFFYSIAIFELISEINSLCAGLYIRIRLMHRPGRSSLRSRT